MSDEYIAQTIVEELTELCPGPRGCHGCQSWCPKCGSVDHVCDDPECVSHRRDTDVQKDIEEAEIFLSKQALKTEQIEMRILLLETVLPKRGDLTDAANRRWELRRAAEDYASIERELSVFKTEMEDVVESRQYLVPRSARAKKRR